MSGALLLVLGLTVAMVVLFASLRLIVMAPVPWEPMDEDPEDWPEDATVDALADDTEC